jgi:hypothetical protein
MKNLPEALHVIKEMRLTASDEWAGSYRSAARQAIATVLRYEMETLISTRPSWALTRGIADRRNGSYPRHKLTEPGDVLLALPRTRRYSPKGVLTAYARRTAYDYKFFARTTFGVIIG